MNTVNRFIITLLTAVAVVGCSGVDPATWDDVAAGVPADGDIYMVVQDSIVRSDECGLLIGDKELYTVLDSALGLCSTRPDRVVGFNRKSRFVFTWPVANPDELAKATEEWGEAELHGDIKARVKVIDGNSIVVSETQVWVVNSRDGVGTVNESLKAASDRSAASVPVLREAVAGNDAVTAVLCRLDTKKDSVRYVSAYPAFVPRGVIVDIEVKNVDGDIVPLIDTSKPIDVGALRAVVGERAYAAFRMPEGFATKMLKVFAGLVGDPSMHIAVAAISPIMERAAGTLVVAVASDGKVEVRLPFVTPDDADKAFANLGALLGRVGIRVDMAVEGDALVFKGAVDLQSLGIDVAPVANPAPTGDEPLIGIADCHVADGVYDVDFEACATAQRVRITVQAPSHEAFRDMVTNYITE